MPIEHGLHPFWAAISNATAVHALKLTLEITAISVPLNTAFGILCAIAIVRHRDARAWASSTRSSTCRSRSRRWSSGSPSISLYGRDGWFGHWLLGHGVQVLFALPAMVLATIFVSLPFVVREVVPVLREIGTQQEEAAATLGASALTTFRRITLPAIRWAIAYGVVLTTARSLGEFGAVSIVSGGIAGRTQTLTQYVQASYENFDQTGAYAASVLLAMLAITTLLLMTVVKRGDRSS